MTNKEIDKILNMLDKKELDNIQKYLLSEKQRNNSIQRQKTFEKYLTTNINGLDSTTLPIIYFGKEKQIFSNGASIYIINKNFLNFTLENLSFEKNKERKTSHRYKIVSKDEINNYLTKVEENLGTYFYEILSIECNSGLINTSYDIEYYDDIRKEKITEKFSKKEIDTSDILLNNPKYSIYSQTPLIKGESDIGKVYILGFKKN